MGKGKIIVLPTSMLRKQIGQFNKLFGLWEKRKRQKLHVAPPAQTEGTPMFLMASDGIRTRHITRRQIVMTRHFTEIISDILSTSLKKQLSDIGTTITNIESKAWNKGVNIYYITDGKFEKSIHEELNSIVSQLRYAITERRLIGRTPLVNFIYDESADLTRKLAVVLSAARTNESIKSCELIETSNNQMKPSRSHKESSAPAKGMCFTAPDDMNNTILGMNYPSLYNEVSAKLERGRGESDRMISNVSLAAASIPFIRGPPTDIDEEDPAMRIMKMQKFLVSQRKKTEYQSKVRRMGELLARDKVKWDLPDPEDEDSCEEVIEKDFHEEQ